MNLNELLNIRRTYNAPLFIEENNVGYDVSTLVEGRRLNIWVDKNTSEASVLQAYSSVWNVPIARDEFRFTTHDFTTVASWDGRTNGDPSASWAADHGGVTYDDVNYRWLDSNGDPVCHLVATESGVGSVWKDQSNNTIVSYNSQTNHWERTDNNANVTSSRWSIIPYPNTKMEIVMANAVFGADAQMANNSSLRYKIYMYVAPYGVINVREFVYSSPLLMQLSANDFKQIGNDLYCSYDYRTTVHPVIDSLAQMRLDIVLDDNAPITSASNRPARAVFIGKKIASF